MAKYIFILDHLRADGTQKFCTKLLKSIKARGFDVKVIALNHSFHPPLLAELVEAAIPVTFIGKLWLVIGFGFIRLLKECRENHGDKHLIVTFLFWSDLFGSIVSRTLRLKHLVSVRCNNTGDSFLKRRVHHTVIRSANTVICNAANVTEIIAEILSPTTLIEHIPNFIDVPSYQMPRPVKEVPEILCVGRLVPQKGVGLLLESCKDIQAKLIIIGAGPLRRKLENLACTLGIHRRVTFTGHIDDLSPYYATADLYVQPSYFEGMPNALMEAMSFGLPCIASNVDGIKELIDGSNGILFEVGNATELSAAINRLISDEPARRILGENARKAIAERYSQDLIVKKWLEMLSLA